MGIYKRTNKIWYANYFDVNKRRQRVSLQTTDKRIAEIKFADIRKKQQIIKDPYSVNISWQDFLLKFNAFLQANRRKPTIGTYDLAIKYLVEFLHPRNLSDITPAKLQDLQTHLITNKKGNASINKHLKCLKSMMRQAEKWDLLPPQKWQNIERLKESKGRLLFFSTQEISALLKNNNRHWQLVILLGARAGLRRGEIATLKWEDIDFKNNQIYVAPNKTENHRYVPLDKDLRFALMSALKSKKNDYVVNIGANFGEKRAHNDYLSSYFSEIKKNAKITKGSLHTLRHTFASHLVQAGVDLYTVSKLLGHTSIKTTERYAHLAPQTLRAAIMRLPKI